MKTNDTWLLVEDDVDDQDFFLMALTGITDKVKCVIAQNGLEALKIIQEDSNFMPSCIFVDLNMPVMNGFDFLQNVNKIQHLAEVPRIVYTTSNAAFDKELVKKLGARFVTKYSSLSGLEKFINDCLSRYTPVPVKSDNLASQFNSTKKQVTQNFESLTSSFDLNLVTLTNQFIYSNETTDVYGLLLDSAMEVMKSDLASIQLYNDATQELKLMATRNFHHDSIQFWQTVSATSGSICGEALRKQTRIIVPDVETIEYAREEIGIFRLSGIRAVQSTPLVSREGKLIGMLSTHWNDKRQLSEKDFESFDVFARLAADLMSQKPV